MELLKGANAGLAFALEIAMLVSYGVFGYSLATDGAIRWIAALAVSGVVVTVWALFAAPTASYRLVQPWLFCLELALMLVAAALVFKLGHPYWALGFALMAVSSQTLALALKQ